MEKKFNAWLSLNLESDTEGKINSTLLIHCKAKNKLKYMDEMEFDQTSQ